MPMTAESYCRAAARLRKFADELEAHCTARTPDEHKALGFVIKNLADYALHLVNWDRRTQDAAKVDVTTEKRLKSDAI